MELRLPLEMSPGREAACRSVFGTWGFSERCPEKLPFRVDCIHRGEFGEVSGHRVLIKKGPEGREPLPDKAGESTLLSRSGGEKGLRGGGAGKTRCSSRERPGFRGTLWVASRVPSALSTSNS